MLAETWLGAESLNRHHHERESERLYSSVIISAIEILDLSKEL